MWEAVSAFAAGGEEAVKMTGGQAATLLLQHLKQEPMPIIEERDRVGWTQTSRNDCAHQMGRPVMATMSSAPTSSMPS